MGTAAVDPVGEALAQALGHEAPFQPAELSAFDGELTISRARDVRALESLGSLTQLTLFASELADVAPLRSLTGLRTLRLLACVLPDLSFVGNPRRLERIEINYCAV